MNRDLLIQLVIGLLPTIILLLAAFWVFGADFSNIKLRAQTNAAEINELHDDMDQINAIAIDIATIKSDVSHMKSDIAEIKASHR